MSDAPSSLSRGGATLQILIEPRNPLDLQRDDLQDLAAAIRQIDSSLDVRFAAEQEQRGYGVTWWEVLGIWLLPTLVAAGGVAGTKVVQRIVDVAVDWARERFRRKPGTRPKYVAIYGPDGKIVRSVRLDSIAGELEDLTDRDREAPPRQRPPVGPD